jgi:hypothetical protein
LLFLPHSSPYGVSLYTEREQEPVVKLVVMTTLVSVFQVALSVRSLECVEMSNAESW